VLSQAVTFGKQQAQYGKETAKPPPIRCRKRMLFIAISFSAPPFSKMKSR